MLQAIFAKLNITNVTFYSSIHAAYESAHQSAEEGEGVVVFGSFHTVSGIHQRLVDPEGARAKLNVMHA